MKTSKGFTLIEMSFVLMIISILVLIAMPNYKMVLEKGKIIATKAEMRNLQTALDLYYGAYNEYPGALNEPKFLREPNDNDGGFIEHILSQGINALGDAWNRDYIYNGENDTQDGYIISKGPDGILNTPDDIIMWLLK